LAASPFDNPIIKGLYDKWLEQPGSVKARRYMHTQYHPVEKSITSQLHNWWGVEIELFRIVSSRAPCEYFCILESSNFGSEQIF